MMHASAERPRPNSEASTMNTASAVSSNSSAGGIRATDMFFLELIRTGQLNGFLQRYPDYQQSHFQQPRGPQMVVEESLNTTAPLLSQQQRRQLNNVDLTSMGLGYNLPASLSSLPPSSAATTHQTAPAPHFLSSTSHSPDSMHSGVLGEPEWQSLLADLLTTNPTHGGGGSATAFVTHPATTGAGASSSHKPSHAADAAANAAANADAKNPLLLSAYTELCMALDDLPHEIPTTPSPPDSSEDSLSSSPVSRGSLVGSSPISIANTTSSAARTSSSAASTSPADDDLLQHQHQHQHQQGFSQPPASIDPVVFSQQLMQIQQHPHVVAQMQSLSPSQRALYLEQLADWLRQQNTSRLIAPVATHSGASSVPVQSAPAPAPVSGISALRESLVKKQAAKQSEATPAMRKPQQAAPALASTFLPSSGHASFRQSSSSSSSIQAGNSMDDAFSDVSMLLSGALRDFASNSQNSDDVDNLDFEDFDEDWGLPGSWTNDAAAAQGLSEEQLANKAGARGTSSSSSGRQSARHTSSSSAAAGSSSSSGNDDDQSERKKLAHLAAEHRRRNHIREAFTLLRDLVPTCKQLDSKAAILRKAADYIVVLKREKAGGEGDENEDLRKKVKFAVDYMARLNRQKAVLVDQLEKANAKISLLESTLGMTEDLKARGSNAPGSSAHDLFPSMGSGAGSGAGSANTATSSTMSMGADLSSSAASPVGASKRKATSATGPLSSSQASAPASSAHPVTKRPRLSNVLDDDGEESMITESESSLTAGAAGASLVSVSPPFNRHARASSQPLLSGTAKLLAVFLLFGFSVFSPNIAQKWRYLEHSLASGVPAVPDYGSGRTLQSSSSSSSSSFSSSSGLGLDESDAFSFYWELLRALGYFLAVLLSWMFLVEPPSNVLPGTRGFKLALEERKLGRKKLFSTRISEVPERHFLNALAYLGASPVPSSKFGLCCGISLEAFKQITHLLFFGKWLAKYAVRRSGSEVLVEELSKTYLLLNQLYFGDAHDMPMEAWYCLLKAINLGESVDGNQTLAKSYSNMAFQVAFRVPKSWVRITVRLMSWRYRQQAVNLQTKIKCSDSTLGYMGMLNAWGNAAMGDFDNACRRFAKASKQYYDAGLIYMAWQIKSFEVVALMVQGKPKEGQECVRFILDQKLHDGSQSQLWWTSLLECLCSAHDESVDSFASTFDAVSAVENEAVKLSWRESGFIRILISQCLLAWVRFRQGHDDSAVEQASTAIKCLRGAQPIGFGIAHIGHYFVGHILMTLWERYENELSQVLPSNTSAGNAAAASMGLSSFGDALETSTRTLEDKLERIRDLNQQNNELYALIAESYPFARPRSCYLNGRTYRLRHRLEKAKTNLNIALVEAEKFNMPFDVASCKLELAKLETDSKAALKQTVEAKQIFDEIGAKYECLLADEFRSTIRLDA